MAVDSGKDMFYNLSFDGNPSGYRDFRRRTLLAVASVEDKNAHLAGAKLLGRLSGEAWRATEHIPIHKLREDTGWTAVIHALDKHYRYLPETELHGAVDNFLFSLKRHPHEGPTSFSSRFRTQLDRLQSLIAQERELHKAKKQKTRKTSSHAGADDNSSVADSEPPDADVPPKEPAPSGSPDTSEHETAQEAAASSSDHDQRAATEPIRSKPPSSIGRDAGHLKRKLGSDGRGSFKADKDKSHRKMQQMLGVLEQGHLKPRPIFPQSILGHLFMKKYGLSREQRASVIRATNGSSRYDDVERILRASDYETMIDERKLDRRPHRPPPRRETFAVQDNPPERQYVHEVHDESTSPEGLDSADSGVSEEIHAAEDHHDPGDTDAEIEEVYELQKKAKLQVKKGMKTYKETKKRVRELKKQRQPYYPVVAIPPNEQQQPGASSQPPVQKQTFKYDRKPSTKPGGPKKPPFKPPRREEANLAQASFPPDFAYMVQEVFVPLHGSDWEVYIASVPVGCAVLDTGCTTSIVGHDTATELKKHMLACGHPEPQTCVLPPVELRGFSPGSVIKTSEGLRWTVRLGCDTGTITTYVVPGNAPFLLSRRVLEGSEARLGNTHLVEQKAWHGSGATQAGRQWPSPAEFV